MSNSCTISNVAQQFSPVKPQLNTQLSLFPDSMIHHKIHLRRGTYIVLRKGQPPTPPYGVSQSRRILSPQLLLKRFDQVRDCLENVLGLTIGQREVTLELIRFFAYYGQVYPKASHFGEQPGSSRTTFWRTIKILRDKGLLNVIQRFIIRPHAQISNLYKFDRLLILIARYLAEHGCPFTQKWLQPLLRMPGSLFWPWILVRSAPGAVSPPITCQVGSF
jgi:hypothetical protein